MAADTSSELAREIATIINSSYPVSPAKLHVICTKTDALTVRACIRQLPPCAVAKLASSLYEALPLCQYCVEILRCLSQSLEFKKELLFHNARLLDALLTKANTSQQAFDQYHGLCVELLSHPLPAAVPLPASVQPFFLRVFEQAYREPCDRTLKPVYYMLNGACRGLYALLPSGASKLFDEQLRKILGSKITGENSMLVLWCFGVATLAEHPELIDIHNDPQNHTASTIRTVEWTTASGRKLFESSNTCEKTMTLACLSVIWAIKGGVGVSDDEALEGIRIATRTLRFIDYRIRDQWVTTDGNARNLISKLLEKLQRRGINSTVQREALYFYAVVGGSNKLSQSIVTSYEAALMDITGWDGIESQNSFSTSLSLFADRIQQASVQSLFCQILNTNISPNSIDQLQSITALVNVIAVTALSHETFRSHILTALSKHEVQDNVKAFLAICPNDFKEHHTTFCRSHDAMIRHTCLLATISMLLTVVLAAGSDLGSHVPSRLGVALVDKQRQLAIPPHQCTHNLVCKPSDSVSLFEQECTPMSGFPLQDWKDRLRAELDSQAFYHRESLIRAVAQICHDLATRCDTVEGPLRCEKDRSRALEEELSRFRACVESLEQERVDDALFLNTLEAEKSRLEKENDELFVRLEDVRAQFEKANSEKETALHKAKETYNHKEIQLKSTILQLEETIESHQEELRVLRERTAALGDELGEQETAKRVLTTQLSDLQSRFEHEQSAAQEQRQTAVRLDDLCNSLQSRLDEAERELDGGRQSAIQKEAEITRLGKEAANLEGCLRQTKSDLAAMTERLHELAQSSTRALQEVEAQYESDLEAAASKAADRYHQIHGAYENMRQNLKRAQLSIPPLQAKIQELQHELSNKDKELEELRAWKTSVYKFMALQPKPALANAEIRECDATLAVPNTTEGFTNTAMDHLANAYYSSSSQISQTGSTPKRPKPRPASKGISSRTSYHDKSFAIPKPPAIICHTQRSALRSISPNQRHTTVGASVIEQKNAVDGRQSLPLRKRRGSLQGSEEANVEVDFLTSTPVAPGSFLTDAGGFQEEGSTTEL